MRILINNILNGANLSATSTEIETAIQNIITGQLFNYWQPSASGLQSFTANFSSARNLDSIGIIGHNLFSSGINEIIIRVFDSFETEIKNETIPINSDDAILYPLSTFDGQEEVYSLSIEFTVVSDLPYIASVIIGESIYTSRSPAFGTDLPIVDNQSSSSSVLNNKNTLLGKVIEEDEGFKMNLRFSHMPWPWVRDTFTPFLKQSINNPYFISLSDKVPNVIYATTSKIVAPKLTSKNKASIQLALEGVFR